MKATLDATQAIDDPQAEGSWLRTLDPNEKRTLTASFSGYAVDAFDYYTLPLVTPILLSLWGMSKTEVGLIGIQSLADPDYGDSVEVMPDEVPVFWACGVTPQAALAAARLPFAITHAPGSMLVTDLLHHSLAAF